MKTKTEQELRDRLAIAASACEDAAEFAPPVLAAWLEGISEAMRMQLHRPDVLDD